MSRRLAQGANPCRAQHERLRGGLRPDPPRTGSRIQGGALRAGLVAGENRGAAASGRPTVSGGLRQRLELTSLTEHGL